MSDEFVTKDICDLKHKEVDKLEETVKDFKEVIFKKLDKINALLIALLSALLSVMAGQLLMLYLKK